MVPSAPTSVEVLTVDEEPGQLDVTWAQPSPPGPLCPITNNSISWSRVDTGGSAGEAEIVASSSYTITGLDPCAQYHVVIKAANEKGYGVQYGDFGNTGAIAPEAPSNITVLMVEDDSEHLGVTWTQPAPPGPLCPITRNSVRWSLNDTGDTVGHDEIIASIAYSITGLKAYTTYVVHVASETDGGFGQEGAAINTTDQDIPGSPIITSLSVSTPSSMLVKWEPPPQPNGVITGYKVEWKYENQEHSIYLNSSQTEYEITNLTACVPHEIIIMAETIKGFGKGNVSDTSMAVAPEAPEDVTAARVPNISDQLKVTWTQPKPYGKCTITNNKVTWLWQHKGQTEQNETVVSATSSHTISGLKPYTKYTVCVAAQTEGGYGPNGNCPSAVTEEDVPGPPVITIVKGSSDSIHLVWKQPVEPNGELLFYNLSWMNIGKVSDYGIETLPSDQTSYTITGLQSNSQYNISLMAKTSHGWGPALAVTVETTKPETTQPWVVWLLIVVVISNLAILVLLVFIISRRNSRPWSVTEENSSGRLSGKEASFRSEEDIHGNQKLMENVDDHASESDELSLHNNAFSPEITFNEDKKEFVVSDTDKKMKQTSERKTLVSQRPFGEVTDGTENNAVHVSHKTETIDNKPNEDAGPYPDGTASNSVPVAYRVYLIDGRPNVDDHASESYELSLHNNAFSPEITFNEDKKEFVVSDTDKKMKQTSERKTLVSRRPFGEVTDGTENNAVHVSHKTESIDNKPNEDAGPYPDGTASNSVPVAHRVDLIDDRPNEDSGPYQEERTNKVQSTDRKQKKNSSFPEKKSSRNVSPLNVPIVAERVERRDDNAVHVNYKEKLTSGKSNSALSTPEEKKAKSVSPPKCPLIQVIEKTENKESILDSKGMKDIHKAAKRGLSDEVVISLNNGEDPSALTRSKNTPLHYAAKEGQTEVVQLLLDKKCDPNLSNEAGDTPLHLAAVNGKIDVVKILSEWEGVDIKKPSATNETLLAYARYGEEKPMLNVLRNPETISPEGNTPLHCASLAGHIEIVQLLLMKNADSKSETPTHHTPLHYAALRGYATLVKLLVFYGADPNVRDERNNTPLHYAALSGHTSVVELLVNERADLSIRTDLGLSVLHKASFYGRLSTVQKLVELQDTLVSIRDEENLRAEDTALIRGHVHTAWWLNKNASEVSLQDQTHLKNTCMTLYNQCGEFYHTYCEDKNTKSTALATAIDFGVCDLHYQDERGRTLLHVAAEQNDRRKIRVLLERGALPTARTHDGETPADLARQKRHLEAAGMISAMAKNKETDNEKNELYTRLLTLITEAATANFQGDNEEQEARLAAVKEASSLLASGAPLEPPGGHSCYPLHLAIGTNCTPLLPLLLAAGAPLTSSADGFGPVQVAWMTPDATPWVGVVVTRAAIHKIQSEMKLLDQELQISAEILVKSLEGDKPWDAKVITSRDSSVALNSRLFRACAAGATTFAWWIWHSGGNTLSQDKDGETPLHAALDAGHLDTATALVLHMGANLFLPDHKGRAPVDLIPDDATREQLLQAILARECARLNDESEKARDPTQKQEARQFVFLLLSLHCAYSSQTDKGREALCWKTTFWWLNKELSESDDWMEKLVLVTRNQDCEDGSFIDFTYDYVLKLITKTQLRYNVLSKILEKAAILSCEKEFPLFLHLLVHVGKQKVTSEIEVCQASLLHYAALKNNISAARYLVSHGASIKAKDRFGNTPAHYACMHGYKDLGDFLKTNQVNRNRNGLTAIDLLDGYRNYLKLYDLDLKSLENIDIQKSNTGPQRINILLKELKKKWQVNGIGEAIAKVHVNYSRGESKDIQAAVFSWADSIKNAVAKKNPMFSGELLMLGSSADNVRLFCPDEYDCNIILSSFNGYPNGGLQVSLEEKEPDYSDCKSKINVSSKNINIKNLLKGNNFLYTFYSMVKECISILEPEDKRLTMIPPGVKRTKVGVGLTLVWTGKEFPLLLVDVDIVPTMEAPWPADLPRPPLTPPHIKSVYINSIGNGEWRFSFAQAENEIMKNLTPDQRRVFLACKMVLSSLKVEKWAPRDIQSRFKYFDKIFFKIPSPKGFILKNTFFLELEEFRDHSYYWTDRSEKRIRSVFERMCEKGRKGPAKIEAYFAGSTQPSCIGYGAPNIVSFFTPKPGFHGVSEY
ncbi:uncharacterized protein LOC122259333 isoform X2 [Penaeus japonicus]|uniref:uncharacterized protein LOC122259333 isoform X2 n=1 Tax=Penaeus japonicus TaxID=27405 RepID=UPI001C714538|nr:uncharacterized protein LOC122259333 isoform X2 [Penaeus japonicus]